MLRRSLRRCFRGGEGTDAGRKGGAQAQRPGSFDWVVREKATPRELFDRFQTDYLNHKVLGFAARCALFAGFCGMCTIAAYRVAVLALESRPIAQQWLPRHREVTFLERIHEGGEADMFIYRFALPNSYDYLGHKAIASVELLVDNHWLWPARRWYTPISHPEQRGIVEFAIKHHTPGEFSQHLRELEPGDKMFMGPWIKEWKYVPGRFREVGFICGNSGVTVALQLLVTALSDPTDTTKFSMLFCNRAPNAIPFKEKLQAIQDKYPDRFRCTFTVNGGASNTAEVEVPEATEKLAEHGSPLSSYKLRAPRPGNLAYDTAAGGRVKPVTLVKADDEDYDGYVGLVNRDLILASIPAPAPDVMLLCAGPQNMMTNLCGRPVGWFRTTYFEGLYYGTLKDMGYSWSQVYKFRTPWSNTFAGVA